MALLKGATLEPGQWIRGGPQSPSCSPPPPVDKEDGEQGGGGCGVSRNSSPPPAPSSGAAETSQPSQRVVLGCMKEPSVGDERGAQRGGLRRWLPSLREFRRTPSNLLAYVPHFAVSTPPFASFIPNSVPTPAVEQLAWLSHGFPLRAFSTATAASSSYIADAVGLAGSLTVQPREVWLPTRNGTETRATLQDWALEAMASVLSATAERRRTSKMDESLPLSACQHCTGYGVLDLTSTSAAIAAAAAAAATAFTVAKTSFSARRGGRSGAVAVLQGGGGVALTLFTGGAACGRASHFEPAGDSRSGFFRRAPPVTAPRRRSLLTC